MGTRIYLPCAADYDIGDCLEIERVKIPAGQGVSYDGGLTAIKDGDTFYVVDDGKGAAGDVDACGNDMEGVPYISVSLVEDGSPITWDTSMAGEASVDGVLSGDLTIATAGSGYNGGAAGTLTGVELISDAAGSGKGGVATVEIDGSGQVTKVTITKGGSGYKAGDILNLEAENGVGTDASIQVPASGVTDVRGDSAEGHYIFRLCDFQTVCGVRSFSLDLSRDELDVTTPAVLSERGLWQGACFFP